MTRAALFFLAALLAAAAVTAPAPPRAGRRGGGAANEDAAVVSAEEALRRGRIEEARSILAAIPAGRLGKEAEDRAAYLGARLAEDGGVHAQLLSGYLTRHPKGAFRREATLALARLRYAEGDYGQAENLLSIFSPGVEKTALGREGLILRALAQMGRGDAVGAQQLLASAETDLKGTPEQEAYSFAAAQAALQAKKPAAASPALRAILEKNPNGDYAPQALYAMGVSLEMMGRQADAVNVFRQVAQRFPASYEATRVRDRGIRPGGGTSTLLPIGGGFAIQVGAFTRRDLAEGLARDLRQAGVADVGVRTGAENPPIYRVRAGSFASRDEARALGERLRRERGFPYQVVPR